jgi:uncharacterized membrane protein
MRSNKQILIKTTVWRFIATLITFFVSWGVSGSLEFGAAIGGIDAVLKFIGYFTYEKIWESKVDGNTE